MMRKAPFIAAILLLAGPACARESAPVTSSRVVATLISDTDTIVTGEKLHLALRLRMKPGWHTYWSNPGDAGAPTELHLELAPDGVSSGIAWPTPLRLPEGPVMAFGYTGEVVLPVTVTPGNGPLMVKATANWLVCEKICVPEEGTFELTLPPGHPSASAEAPLFAKAAAATPRAMPFSAHIAPDGTLTLSGEGLSQATVADAWFFPSGSDVIDQDAEQPVSVRDNSVSLTLKPGPSLKSDVGLSGVVVLKDRGGEQSSFLVNAVPGNAPAPSTPVWQTLLAAMLGGLLLNLMPCVFPVLAMKAVALARLSGQARGAIRAEAVAYMLGVMAAFAGLGAILIVARRAGALAGWGFQFQSPVFVAVMSWLMFAVGLNLSGVYAVGGQIAGAGQALTLKRGHAGSFFTGLLAVLVAAPCTAPFMGAAIAVALAASPLLTMTIFLAMGFGLALPSVALALLPWLSRALPRPGAWMDVFKSVLAFPMYGAAAWLVWVISLQSGPDGVFGAAAGLVLVGFAAWAAGLAQNGGKRIVYAASIIATVAAFALLPMVGSAQPATASTSEAGGEPFSPVRLAALRAEGRPVFVNMTAAWCVTCLVNERLALSSLPVQQAFSDHHVAYLKGDWTRSDPAITAYLRSFQRDGVPLYVFYPGNHSEPEVLPQILTKSEVLSQFAKVGS